MELDQAGRRLRAALAAVLVQNDEPELDLVHRWPDSWRGVGLLAVGLHRIGYDLDVRQYGDGHWRASFYVTGLTHSILGGSAWEPMVWRAVQRAGWNALQHAERTLTGRSVSSSATGSSPMRTYAQPWNGLKQP